MGFQIKKERRRKKEKHVASRSKGGTSGVHIGRQSHPVTTFKTSFGIGISMEMWVGRGILFLAGVGELQYGKAVAEWGQEARLGITESQT